MGFKSAFKGLKNSAADDPFPFSTEVENVWN